MDKKELPEDVKQILTSGMYLCFKKENYNLVYIDRRGMFEELIMDPDNEVSIAMYEDEISLKAASYGLKRKFSYDADIKPSKYDALVLVGKTLKDYMKEREKDVRTVLVSVKRRTWTKEYLIKIAGDAVAVYGRQNTAPSHEG